MIKYTFTILLFTSCCINEKPCVIKEEIVVAKFSKDFPKSREPIYKIATNKGLDAEVSYGYYSILDIGDTVIVKDCYQFKIITPLEIY